MATSEEVFHKYWLEKFNGYDRVSHTEYVDRISTAAFYDMLRQAFIAGRESAEPVINPEWCEEIVTLHRSNSNFWTVSELSRLFQLSEEQVREILNVKQDTTG